MTVTFKEPDRPASRRFDHAFFQEWLTPLVAEWREQRNLDPLDAIVEMTTVRGGRFTVDAIRVGATWLMVFTDDDELHFVPMDEVALVTLHRRPGPAPEKVLGFTQGEPVEVDAPN